jgi:ABC-2 type transport system permease protein
MNVLGELQYRVNFFVQLLQSAIAVTTGIIALSLVFRQVDTLAGWSPAALLAVLGVHVLVGGIIRAAIQPNMARLIGDVRDGALDQLLLKPADGQALVSVREFRPWALVDVVVGGVVLAWALTNTARQTDPGDALAFAYVLLLGALTIYSVWLVLASTTFWVIRSGDLLELFNGIYAAGRWPVTIYPGWLRIGLTVLVPVAFAVTVPAQAITGQARGEAIVASTVVALVALLVARIVWRRGLRRYSGASA